MTEIVRPEPFSMLARLRLVPIEVFGTGCQHENCTDPAHEPGYGLCDAVSAWSDCNRVRGRMYRVDDADAERYRLPGETVEVWVNEADLPWFNRTWGDEA